MTMIVREALGSEAIVVDHLGSEGQRGIERSNQIVYRATVEEVSQVDIALKVIPASDGEDPITPRDGFDRIRVNVPGAANAEDVGAVLRAFGAIIGIEGAVRLTVEPAGTR